MRTLLLILSITLAPFSWAQDADLLAEGVTSHISAELSLNGDQEQKVLEAQTIFAKTLISLRDSDGSRREKGKKLRSAAEQRDDRIKAVLTDEQWEKYEILRDEQRQKMREQMKARKANS